MNRKIFTYVFSSFYILVACSISVQAQDESILTSNNFQKVIPGIYFKSADVKLADTLLHTNNTQAVIETLIQQKALYISENNENHELVYSPNNSFIQTIQECYDSHRPLVLTPDIIWLQICQGVSLHVNQNFDSLEKTLFTKNRPSELIIRNDSLSSGQEHWEQLIQDFALKTQEYTSANMYDFFVPQFSTTSQTNTIAYQITLLETYKKAFTYVGESGCGIPYITVMGSKEDWQNIYNKLPLLHEFGLDQWVLELQAIIQEFINVYDYNINQEFWNDIYKNVLEYNAFYISGWCIKLFPYIVTLNWEESYMDTISYYNVVPQKLKQNPFLYNNTYLQSTLSTDDFPSGISKVPLVWNDYNSETSYNMMLYSGFMGIKQYDDLSLETNISWAICYKDAELPEYELHNNYGNNSFHTIHWYPFIVDSLSIPAVYNSKTFANQDESLTYIKNLITDSLSKKEAKLLAGDTLKIIVLCDGSLGSITFSEHSKLALQTQTTISNIILHLPNPWFPALAFTNKFGEFMFQEDQKPYKIRVNSEVKIVF